MWDEIIETDKYIIRLKNNSSYMEYEIKPDVIYEANDARKAKRDVVDRRNGEKFYVLGEGVEFFTLTKQARELCSTKEHLDNTKAIAFYTTNTSLLILGEMYNKINKPAVPTKIFTNRDAAKEWLEEQRQKNNDPPF